MRVVAMRLMMEVILFIKLYLALDGLSFRSVSTHLQNNSSGWPLMYLQYVRVRAYNMRPIKLLYSHRGCCVTRFNGHQSIPMATGWSGPFRGKATLPTLVPPALYIITALSLNMPGTSGSMWIFKHCIPGIHSINSQLQRKYVSEKDPVPTYLWH